MIDKASVDRFEGAKAVLLVGEGERQLIVNRDLLPAGIQEGHWLQVELKDGTLVRAELDLAETESARARIASKLDRLRRGDYLRDG